MKLIAATNNQHKVMEFKRILRLLGFEVMSQAEAGVEIEVDENADTFAGNARLKAEAVFAATGVATVADDSGLEVYALKNAPGVYSARYGGEGLDDKGRYEKLLCEMKNVKDEDRGARFVCSICLVLSDAKKYSFTGVCEGKIAYQPDGENGFGYDPIFLVGGKSFSALTPQEKDEMSHRGKALREMARAIEAEMQNQPQNKGE